MNSKYITLYLGIVGLLCIVATLAIETQTLKDQEETEVLEIALSHTPTHDASKKNTFEVPADSVLVADTKLDYIYYAKNISHIKPIASITKLMTAMVVIDNYNLANVITISPSAVSYIDKDTFSAGENIKVFDLLIALLIESSNEAAYALAENWPHEDGPAFIKQSKFIEAMNKKAKELGMVKTTFTNPSGLDDGTNVSSAWDVGILAHHALRYPIIRDISIQPYTTIYSEQGIAHKFQNTNKLLGMVPGIELGKTGLTDDAGQTLTLAIKKENTPLIIVLLNAKDRFLNAKEIIEKISL